MEKTIYSNAYTEFLTQLRTTRLRKGVTQTELARRLRVTQSFVSKCERGERRIDIAEAQLFCEALGVDFVAFVEDFHDRLKRLNSQSA